MFEHLGNSVNMKSNNMTKNVFIFQTMYYA